MFTAALFLLVPLAVLRFSVATKRCARTEAMANECIEQSEDLASGCSCYQTGKQLDESKVASEELS